MPPFGPLAFGAAVMRSMRATAVQTKAVLTPALFGKLEYHRTAVRNTTMATALPRALPTDFGFRGLTVETAKASSDGRALEQIHKLLQAHPAEPFALHGGALLLNAADPAMSEKPLMLLGIMSGNEGRRRVMRCAWGRSPELARHMRVLFVVGTPRPLQREWELSQTDAMELRVNVSEGLRVWRAPQADARKHQSFTGTFSTYFKQVTFLRFAALQPEPLIGRADDDVFISPHTLLAYAMVLRHMPHPIYGGVFEWISWRAPRLEATGFSYGLAEARGRAKAPHRNCSREEFHAESDAYDHACEGPFAYAKGPLLMMNQRALQWLVRAKIFQRDLRRAWDMVEGRAPTRKGRIDDDINLGYWMARMPELRLLRLRRVVWKDTWRDGADAAMLLAAHKMPWELHGEAHNITSAMWETSTTANVAALCRDDAPPCTSCSHARSQRVCILEVGVETNLQASECIRAPKKGTGCPRFVRESHPEDHANC